MTTVNLYRSNSAAIHQLEAGNGLFFMNRISEPLKPGDILVIPAGCLSDVTLSLPGLIHVYTLHKAQTPHDTFGPSFDIGNIGIGHKTIVIVQVILRGRILDSVRHDKIPYLNLLEQMGVCLCPRV
jgi:hypothetical protein